jgi:hypothetical protein
MENAISKQIKVKISEAFDKWKLIPKKPSLPSPIKEVVNPYANEAEQ